MLYTIRERIPKAALALCLVGGWAVGNEWPGLRVIGLAAGAAVGVLAMVLLRRAVKRKRWWPRRRRRLIEREWPG